MLTWGVSGARTGGRLGLLVGYDRLDRWMGWLVGWLETHRHHHHQIIIVVVVVVVNIIIITIIPLSHPTALTFSPALPRPNPTWSMLQSASSLRETKAKDPLGCFSIRFWRPVISATIWGKNTQVSADSWGKTLRARSWGKNVLTLLACYPV